MNTESMGILSAIFVLFAFLPYKTDSSGVFELRLVHFTFVSKWQSPLTNRTIFRVCLKQYQTVIDPNPPCTFGGRSVEIDGDFEKDPRFTRPFRFAFSYTWPKTFSLIVEAWAEDSADRKTLLVRLARQKTLASGPIWTNEKQTLEEGKAGIELDYRVVCDRHFFGDQCNVYCRPRNNDVIGHFECTKKGRKRCIQGWNGVNCDKPVCLPNCLHGSCQHPGECVCKLGYIGDLCDQCQRYPGCKHGTCDRPFKCTCDEDLNYCTRHRPCANGATCTNTGAGHYTCTCRNGYGGTNCEVKINDCSQRPCLNGGSCREIGSSNYTCECPPGVAGRHCQISATDCRDHPCRNGATCVTDVNGAYTCLCPDGWLGANCDTEKRQCNPNPCNNGGRCVEKPSSFQCVCPVGFEGPLCSINVDDCQQDACKNGGLCVDEINSFKCRCPAGFSGSLCQHDVDECALRPCANGGTCFDLVGDFRCMCRPGYRGHSCTVDINECQSSPCRNGASCQDFIDSFVCTCRRCYSGQLCTVREDNCHENDITLGNYSLSSFISPRSAGSNDNSRTVMTIISSFLFILFSIIVTVLLAIILHLYRRSKRPPLPVDPETQNVWNAAHLHFNNDLKRRNNVDIKVNNVSVNENCVSEKPLHHKLSKDSGLNSPLECLEQKRSDSNMARSRSRSRDSSIGDGGKYNTQV